MPFAEPLALLLIAFTGCLALWCWGCKMVERYCDAPPKVPEATDPAAPAPAVPSRRDV